MKFWRRKHRSNSQYVQVPGAVPRFTSEEGWTEWVVCPPPNVLCEFIRESWTEGPLVSYPIKIRPEVNMAGFYWRLTGIGKEEMERWSDQQRREYEAKRGWGGFVYGGVLSSSGLGATCGFTGWNAFS